MKMLFDRVKNSGHAPGAVVAMPGIVIGEPGLAGFRISITVSAKIEDEQIVLVASVEQFAKRLLDAALGRLTIAQIDVPIVRHAGLAEELDKLPIAALLLAFRKRTPDVRVLPLEHTDDEDAGSLGIPIERRSCVKPT